MRSLIIDSGGLLLLLVLTMALIAGEAGLDLGENVQDATSLRLESGPYTAIDGERLRRPASSASDIATIRNLATTIKRRLHESANSASINSVTEETPFHDD